MQNEYDDNEPFKAENIDPNHRCGWAALIGPPNAGKSTLLNAYLGQKLAIVTPKPQTTRNQITGILTQDNAQVVFFDTPGIHRQRGRMNRALLQTAWQALAAADVIVLVLDAQVLVNKPRQLERELDSLAQRVTETGRPLAVALNKTDRVKDKRQLLPLLAEIQRTLPVAELFPISALKPQGLDGLLNFIISHLPVAPPMYPEDQASTISLRFMVSEIIREQLFLSLQQELPYATAVEIEEWEDEPELNRIRIGAVIYVARKTHKAMVIGKGGQAIKDVGSKARAEISDLLESRVHLDLWVKVRDDWTEDQNFLRMLGLTP